MNRRSFLSALAASLVLDPERALWVPGKKLISIPPLGHRWVKKLISIPPLGHRFLPLAYITEAFLRQLKHDMQFNVVPGSGYLHASPRHVYVITGRRRSDGQE